MKKYPIDGRHEELYSKLTDSIRNTVQEFDDIPAIHQLAILCNIVGKLVALQDATIYTAEMVMDLVAKNIQQGNYDAVNTLLETKGSA